MTFHAVSSYFREYLRHMPWGRNVEAAQLETVVRAFLTTVLSEEVAAQCRVETWNGTQLTIGVPHPAVGEAVRGAEEALLRHCRERGCVVERLAVRIRS